MDEDTNIPECPACGGEGSPMGALGYREYLRCRQCGWEFSYELPREEPDEVQA